MACVFRKDEQNKKQQGVTNGKNKPKKTSRARFARGEGPGSARASSAYWVVRGFVASAPNVPLATMKLIDSWRLHEHYRSGFDRRDCFSSGRGSDLFPAERALSPAAG